MATHSNRVSLGEFLGMEYVGPLVEKSLFGGYQVRYVPFPWAGLQVFIKGVVLGRALHDKAEVLARLLGKKSSEQKMEQGFGEVAEKMLEDCRGLPDSLLDLWEKAAAPEGHGFSDLNTLQGLYKRKEPLDAMLPWLTMWCWEGVGFGVTYPDHVAQMWRSNFETTSSQESWNQARTAGLDLPEHPEPISLEEMERGVLEAAREYARTDFPDILDDIQ